MRRLYRSIALGGGGVRGGLHIGALRAIQEVQGDLEFPDGIYGASIGAFIATAVAFRIELPKLRNAFEQYGAFSNFVPDLTLDHLLTIVQRKGLFSMDRMLDMSLKIFDECGVDLRNKCISDAPQKLWIISSNMTSGDTTLLTGKVPILDAFRCSMAIPLIFEPQVLYGSVYLDSVAHVPCIQVAVPHNTLVVHISGEFNPVTPSSSLTELLYAVYRGRAKHYKGSNVLRFRTIPIGPLSDLSQTERDLLIQEGYSQALTFLTQRAAKESL
jgi:predicted acylesterase/phospholipase RssA